MTVVCQFNFVVGPDITQRDSTMTSLPSYPGFQKDVFRAIEDHYESTLKEPLMCFHMFKILEKATGKLFGFLCHVCDT